MIARVRTAARLSISVVAAVFLALVFLAPAAHAAPTPTPTPTKSEDPCGLIYGPGKDECERQTGSGGGSGGGSPSLTDPTSTLDPLTSLADGIAKTAAWTVDQLSNAVAATSDIDFTNTKFLQTYALVFAASTFLVLLLWLWAVIKRAIRGAPLMQALGEAIGLLWVTVLASAFTPLILYTVVSAVDGLTQAIAGEGSTKFFAAFSDALRDENTAEDGGPFARIALSLVSILAAGVVWLEMVIRSALLYVGAVLGLVVYSGIVDRQLWGRVRKWVGIMAAIILLKPIIIIVLRLASAMAEGGEPADSTAAIISGLAIIIIAITASALLFRFVPGMGDEIVSARRDTYDPASRQAAAIVTAPVSGITQGINTHATRDVASRAPATQSAQSAATSASGGIAAHSTRPTRSDVPSQDNRRDS
ncbi:hypothetical protein [Streptomyces sp. NBC_01373]|uniref:hypothetical protein n=1 Tax=Streptomyces sp. NBC_01373 TaxID=2903843 RepID=UPI0022521E64|nr:hypothetical protein [Streptomyces sp. NBC_01373]MCX4707147.1 hypothetical protein [Streptomyces sp. NBC_01373]